MTLKDGTHISWWPSASRSGLLQFMNIYDASAIDPQSYTDDVTLEGRPPDHSIKINGLDEVAIKKWWKGFKSKNKWKTFSQNCSTTTADALSAGGADKFSPIFDSNNIIWTPSDVLGLAKAINKGIKIRSTKRLTRRGYR